MATKPEPEEQRQGLTDSTLTTALERLIPWQRTLLFVLGAVVFMVPVLDHVINEIIRGHEGQMSVLHLAGDGIFLFAGILGMVPQLGIRVIDQLAVWRSRRQ